MNSDLNSPLFIIGNPRSGTTLLRLMITSHPQILIPPECGFAVWWHNKWQNWDKMNQDIDKKIDLFLFDLFESKKIDTWDLSKDDLRRYLIEKSPASYPELISSIYIYYGITIQKDPKLWGDKNNFYLNHIPTIRSMYPNAYFLHIVRDGRDVATSYKKLKFARIKHQYAPQLSDDIEQIAIEWKEALEKIHAGLSECSQEHVFEIRYEDLVRYPEKYLNKICSWLGIKYDPDMLKYHILNKEKTLEPRDFLMWKQKTLEKPMPQEIGKHKLELSPDEINEFENKSSKFLKHYGYK